MSTLCLVWHIPFIAIQTTDKTSSKSLLCPSPQRSGISSISWLCVLSDIHNNVTISSWDSDASSVPAQHTRHNQAMSYFNTFHTKVLTAVANKSVVLHVAHSLWTMAVLCGTCVAICGDDADRPVCCSSHTKNFLGDVTKLAIILFSFSSFSTCLLYILLLPTMKPVD